MNEKEKAFLAYALDLAEDDMYSSPDEFEPEDWDALAKFRKTAEG